MKPDSWSRVEQVFHLALKVEESQRAAFLEQTCAGDMDLRREVEALIAADKKAETFLESPALEVLGQTPRMPPPDASGEDRLPGSTVSHYLILERLGGGGIGAGVCESPRLVRANPQPCSRLPSPLWTMAISLLEAGAGQGSGTRRRASGRR